MSLMIGDPVSTALTSFLQNVSKSFTAYLVAIGALGTLSMSILQAAKTLLPIRKNFQSDFTTKWFNKHAGLLKRHLDICVHPSEAEQELISLAADGNAAALFAAENDDFCKQVAAVAQLVVDYPNVYRNLFLLMNAGADQGDLRMLTSGFYDDRQQWLDARNRVRQLATQSMSAFQLDVVAEWKKRMQISSFLLSLVLCFIALWVAYGSVTQVPYFSMLISSIIAAFLAPVARDLVAALEKLRS